NICSGGITQLGGTTGGEPKMVISEVTINTGGTGTTSPLPPNGGTRDDKVEFNNISTVPMDISGWTMRVYPTNSTTVSHTFTFPEGTIVPAFGVVVVNLGGSLSAQPELLLFYTTGTTTYTSGGALGVVLYDDGMAVHDAVGLNTYTFAPGTGVTPEDWTGSATSPSTHAGTVRTGA